MKRSTKLSGVLAAALLSTMVSVPVAADEEEGTVTTRLSSYNETPVTINSLASGEFTARILDDGTAIEYELTYRDLSSPATQAHIHFGRPALTGGVVLFLCNVSGSPPGTVPTPPTCPSPSGTVTGTLTAADVIPLPISAGLPGGGQGIDDGAAGLAEILKAIRAGAAYANVHTQFHPTGEIRGRLRAHGHDDH